MRMTRTGRVLGMMLVVGLACAPVVLANGFNLNGMGSKAIGMGGAFIGLADDPSAVFWNPAGLTQTKRPTAFAYGMELIPTGTYRWQYPALGVNIDAKTTGKMYPAGGAAYVRPVGKKLVLGLTVYAPAGTGAKWDGAQFSTYPGLKGVAYEWESYLALISAGPVIAYQVSDKVSLGATLVASHGTLNLRRPGLGQYKEELTASTYGATIGMRVRATERISWGVTFRTPSNLKFKGDGSMSGVAQVVAPLTTVLGLTSVPAVPTTSSVERKATWPMWMGFGVAAKATDRLTFTADAQLTKWKEIEVIPVVYGDAAWRTLQSPPAALLQHPQLGPSLRSLAMAFDQSFALKWKDSVQLRFGAEYALDKVWALRAGYYYDPSPSIADTLNVLLPEATYHVANLGVGAKKGRLQIDACIEALFGVERDAPVAGFPLTVKMPGSHNVRILAPNVSVSYGF